MNVYNYVHANIGQLSFINCIIMEDLSGKKSHMTMTDSNRPKDYNLAKYMVNQNVYVVPMHAYVHTYMHMYLHNYLHTCKFTSDDSYVRM